MNPNTPSGINFHNVDHSDLVLLDVTWSGGMQLRLTEVNFAKVGHSDLVLWEKSWVTRMQVLV